MLIECLAPIDPPIIIKQGFDSRFTHKVFDREDFIENEQFCLDFICEEGSRVYATKEGVVHAIKVDSDFNYFPRPGEISDGKRKENAIKKANYICIDHGNGLFSVYVHLQKNGSVVAPGKKVGEKELIGYSGNTGYSSHPHLHFSFKKRSGNDIITVQFTLVDYDGPLFDRDIRPEVYSFQS